MLHVVDISAFVEHLATTRAVAGIARRVARCSFAALVLLAAAEASAQSPHRTTVGHLLGGSPVDTIEVEDRWGGPRGSQGASLRLVRGDSGYTGTLRMLVVIAARIPNVPAQRCDTVMTASMTASAAKRLFAFLRPTAIVLGEASHQLQATDVTWNASDRFTSGSNAVVVRDGSMLLHGESRYRTPLKRDRKGRILPPSQFLDPDTRLMKVHGMLRPYLQPDLLLAFSRTCGS